MPENLVERELYLEQVIVEYNRKIEMRNNSVEVIVTILVMAVLIIAGTWLCLGV